MRPIWVGRLAKQQSLVLLLERLPALERLGIGFVPDNGIIPFGNV